MKAKRYLGGLETDFEMPSPDIDYETAVNGRARIRVEIGKTAGDVDWFVVQLEYNMVPTFTRINDWRQVARFDHQPGHHRGHDIRVERLHMDVYRDESKEFVRRGFPPKPVNEAPAYCETYLRKHADFLIGRFERWHGVANPTV